MMIEPSTDAEWRAYYEKKCREQRNEIARLEATRERLIRLLQKLGYDVTEVLRGQDSPVTCEKES